MNCRKDLLAPLREYRLGSSHCPGAEAADPREKQIRKRDPTPQDWAQPAMVHGIAQKFSVGLHERGAC